MFHFRQEINEIHEILRTLKKLSPRVMEKMRDTDSHPRTNSVTRSHGATNGIIGAAPAFLSFIDDEDDFEVDTTLLDSPALSLLEEEDVCTENEMGC